MFIEALTAKIAKDAEKRRKSETMSSIVDQKKPTHRAKQKNIGAEVENRFPFGS
jgi:hypothetical protein